MMQKRVFIPISFLCTKVKNVNGTHELTAYKHVCGNYYAFRSQQISVCVDGKEILVSDRRMGRFVYDVYPPVKPLVEDGNKRLSTETYALDLQRYEQCYVGEMKFLKTRFDMFKFDIERLPLFPPRRIT